MKRSVTNISPVPLISLIIFVFSSPALAKQTGGSEMKVKAASGGTEIKVTLLGQPCSLRGPLDEKKLRMVHAIGPAQVYPDISGESAAGNKDEIKKSLAQIKAPADLPELLDPYRERLTRRLEAQLAFFSEIEKIPENHAPEVFFTGVKSYLRTDPSSDMKTLVSKLKNTPAGTRKYSDLVEQIFEIYNESIEPDPQKEFHKVIKRLNIQYQCSFESN